MDKHGSRFCAGHGSQSFGEGQTYRLEIGENILACLPRPKYALMQAILYRAPQVSAYLGRLAWR